MTESQVWALHSYNYRKAYWISLSFSILFQTVAMHRHLGEDKNRANMVLLCNTALYSKLYTTQNFLIFLWFVNLVISMNLPCKYLVRVMSSPGKFLHLWHHLVSGSTGLLSATGRTYLFSFGFEPVSQYLIWFLLQKTVNRWSLLVLLCHLWFYIISFPCSLLLQAEKSFASYVCLIWKILHIFDNIPGHCLSLLKGYEIDFPLDSVIDISLSIWSCWTFPRCFPELWAIQMIFPYFFIGKIWYPA